MAPSALHLFLGVILAVQPGCGFNIDLRFPVVKEGKTKGSFFGFSVAQHKQTQKGEKYLLLTGAPREKAPSNLKVNETGAVYSCPITSDVADCTRMDIITSTDSSEMIEGMWLGVTVASQRDQPDGRVLACGHRYVKVVPGGIEEQRRMVGKCYVRGNDLTYDNRDDWQNHPYEVCNHNFDMEKEGMCNMGISGGMTKSDVYIGCTGSYLWQGNVHVTWRDTSPGNSWDYNDRDLGQQAKRNSYMGYSVTEETKLLDGTEFTLVTGAPRDESRGSVTLAAVGNSDLVVKVTIPGEQVGSYFGSSIAVTDLNNDNWNDLIVGAPFYFDRYKEQGGAVYVFMNENGSFGGKKMVLKGMKGSGFGIAVAAIGDINQDGFQDFAVGAPFHGSGKVYIWTGSKEGIMKDPSQVIEGNSVGSGGFQTFGYSLSGGMDMDGNKYPDILVGSLDDRIALLRARPVIQLSRTFTVEPKIVDPLQCKDACVTVKMCFAYTLSNGNPDFKNKISVKYTVEADRALRNPRVQFTDTKLNTNTGVLTFSSSTCQELKLSVTDQIKNKLDPVVFLLNVSLVEPDVPAQSSLQNLDVFPVLSSQQRVTEKAEINFQKECGADNKCSSNLQVKGEFANEDQDPFSSNDKGQMMEYNSVVKLTLLLEVSNLPEPGREAEDAHQAMLNITIPPTLKYYGLRPQGIDIQCTANVTVICDLGNPFKSNKQINFHFIFQTSITLYTDQIQTQLQLSTLSEQSDLNPVSITLNVRNNIAPSFTIDNSVENTFFSGKVMGESGMKTISDVGSPVKFVFKVSVSGEPLGEMGTLFVVFDWPVEVLNGKWLLYLTEILTTGTSEQRCVPDGQIVNPLNLTLSEKNSKRNKRDLDVNLPQTEAARTLLSPRKESHLLDCSKQTARCVTFSCPLTNMSTSAEITVRARVWNTTMLEDYANTFRVIVKGHATLMLVTDKPAIKMENKTLEFTVNIDPVPGEETPYNAPLWIYIVAGVAGILLLGIITLILWKCGFFKRASRREMYEAKAQKAEMRIQPSETEKLTEDY